MSVLNEVLKNLDEQGPSRHAYRMSNPVYHGPVMPWFVWCIILVLAITSGFLAYKLSEQNPPALDIPYDLYDFTPIAEHKEDLPEQTALAVPPEVKSQKQVAVSSKQPPQVVKSETEVEQSNVVEQLKAVKQPKAAKQSKIVKQESVPAPIVKKTAATEAEEGAIDAYESGNMQTVKSLIKHTQPSIRENFELRIMLRENPEKVLPYLKQYKPDFINNAELLALAAQAQQRSGDYRTSALYYQRLIKKDRSEPKWHAGLAISLDGLGQKERAMVIYQSVLKSSELTVPLRQFVQQRLIKLGRQNG